ncbi:ISAs1 family transposase (plasmid) [Tenacibaculum finnmarkense]|nr:ISAs1 family transposase [Tenacibaculum finnmarkense]
MILPWSTYGYSAWADQNNLVLGQVRVNEKSNEITAIPELLDTLCVAGNIIILDSIGTQTNITNYMLAVKGNQKQLLGRDKHEFKFSNSIEIDIDHGHGRIETRKRSVISSFKFTQNTDNKWNSLNQVIKTESISEFKNSDKLSEKVTRHYISNLKDTAVNNQSHIRFH